jgi:recombination protein RecT
MSNNAELARQVIERSGGQMTPAAFELVAKDWFVTNKRKMQTMCGGDLQVAQQMMVALMQSISKIPALLSCRPDTLFGSLMQCAASGLFPGPLQECAIVPFKGEAVWMPMYGGLCKLAFNSGHVKGVSRGVVYEADKFDYNLGSDPFVMHKLFLGPTKDRGERVCAYSVISTRFGNVIEVKSMEFIEGIKKRSPAARSDKSPWNNGNPDDYDAMAAKTVLKQALKVIPKSVKLAEVIEIDNNLERDSGDKEGQIFDVMETVTRMGLSSNTTETPPEGEQRPPANTA